MATVTLTCQTPECLNNGIAVDVDLGDGQDGEEIATVMCGPCGATLWQAEEQT